MISTSDAEEEKQRLSSNLQDSSHENLPIAQVPSETSEDCLIIVQNENRIADQTVTLTYSGEQLDKDLTEVECSTQEQFDKDLTEVECSTQEQLDKDLTEGECSTQKQFDKDLTEVECSTQTIDVSATLSRLKEITDSVRMTFIKAEREKCRSYERATSSNVDFQTGDSEENYVIPLHILRKRARRQNLINQNDKDPNKIIEFIDIVEESEDSRDSIPEILLSPNNPEDSATTNETDENDVIFLEEKVKSSENVPETINEGSNDSVQEIATFHNVDKAELITDTRESSLNKPDLKSIENNHSEAVEHQTRNDLQIKMVSDELAKETELSSVQDKAHEDPAECTSSTEEQVESHKHHQLNLTTNVEDTINSKTKPLIINKNFENELETIKNSLDIVEACEDLVERVSFLEMTAGDDVSVSPKFNATPTLIPHIQNSKCVDESDIILDLDSSAESYSETFKFISDIVETYEDLVGRASFTQVRDEGELSKHSEHNEVSTSSAEIQHVKCVDKRDVIPDPENSDIWRCLSSMQVSSSDDNENYKKKEENSNNKIRGTLTSKNEDFVQEREFGVMNELENHNECNFASDEEKYKNICRSKVAPPITITNPNESRTAEQDNSPLTISREKDIEIDEINRTNKIDYCVDSPKFCLNSINKDNSEINNAASTVTSSVVSSLTEQEFMRKIQYYGLELDDVPSEGIAYNLFVYSLISSWDTLRIIYRSPLKDIISALKELFFKWLTYLKSHENTDASKILQTKRYLRIINHAKKIVEKHESFDKLHDYLISNPDKINACFIDQDDDRNGSSPIQNLNFDKENCTSEQLLSNEQNTDYCKVDYEINEETTVTAKASVENEATSVDCENIPVSPTSHECNANLDSKAETLDSTSKISEDSILCNLEFPNGPAVCQDINSGILSKPHNSDLLTASINNHNSTVHLNEKSKKLEKCIKRIKIHQETPYHDISKNVQNPHNLNQPNLSESELEVNKIQSETPPPHISEKSEDTQNSHLYNLLTSPVPENKATVSKAKSPISDLGDFSRVIEGFTTDRVCKEDKVNTVCFRSSTPSMVTRSVIIKKRPYKKREPTTVKRPYKRKNTKKKAQNSPQENCDEGIRAINLSKTSINININQDYEQIKQNSETNLFYPPHTARDLSQSNSDRPLHLLRHPAQPLITGNSLPEFARHSTNGDSHKFPYTFLQDSFSTSTNSFSVSPPSAQPPITQNVFHSDLYQFPRPAVQDSPLILSNQNIVSSSSPQYRQNLLSDCQSMASNSCPFSCPSLQNSPSPTICQISQDWIPRFHTVTPGSYQFPNPSVQDSPTGLINNWPSSTQSQRMQNLLPQHHPMTSNSYQFPNSHLYNSPPGVSTLSPKLLYPSTNAMEQSHLGFLHSQPSSQLPIYEPRPGTTNPYVFSHHSPMQQPFPRQDLRSMQNFHESNYF